MDPVHLSPYGPAARVKRRNEEAGYTTEPNRFAPNPPQKPLAFSWASIYDTQVRVALYAEHGADEFDLQLRNAEGAAIRPEAERTWVAQHEHDDEVGSIAIERDGDVDPEKLDAWIGELLRERGVDIFRMKGSISLAGESRRFVFQGVHMLIDSQPDSPWGDSPRRNQLVFIGRDLDEQSMRQGFEACLV